MIRILFYTFILLSIKASYSQCGNRYKNVLYTQVDVSTHTYGQNTKYDGSSQTLKLDLYLPKGDTFRQRPCVVFCFGGAFVTGTRASTELSFFANFLAQRGFVCASIDYRLDNSTNMTNNGENGAVIRAVQDAKASIRYLKSKSTEWSIDTNMMFIGGTSAGGVTALTLGYSQYGEFNTYIKSKIDSLGGWEGTTNSLPYSSRVKGLFNFAGAVLDTSHIQIGDIPVYLNHAISDATVRYHSGYPLNGQSTTYMHGSGNIAIRLKNLNIAYVIDSFESSDHPAFITSNFIKTIELSNQTAENLRKFLYKTMECDASSSMISQNMHSFFNIQNPIQDYIVLPNEIEQVSLYNQMGLRIFYSDFKVNKIDVSTYPKGFYYLEAGDQRLKLIKE